MNAQTLPPALRRFWLLMAAGTALSILYTAASAYLFRLPAPYGLPLLWGKGFGSDFMTFYPGFSHFGTDTFWFSFDYPFTYPAPAAIAFAALFKLSHPVRTYLLLCIVALAVGMAAMARQLIRSHISAGTAWAFTITNAIMAWPILLLFDTANIEGLVAILLAGGVLAILWNRFWLGAILVGIAGSMKLFPLILLGLLLSKRRYKEFAAALFVAAAVTVASLHLLGPTIVEAQRHINVGLVMVKNIYFFAEGRNTTAFDHSLWVPVRFAAAWIARSHSFQNRTLTAYLCTLRQDPSPPRAQSSPRPYAVCGPAATIVDRLHPHPSAGSVRSPLRLCHKQRPSFGPISHLYRLCGPLQYRLLPHQSIHLRGRGSHPRVVGPADTRAPESVPMGETRFSRSV